MGLGHVPQEPVRAEGEGADVQGRQRRGTSGRRPVDLTSAARGRLGEDLAAQWYADHGYRIIERNWRCDTGELDLVVGAPDGTVVFSEVKARRTGHFGDPSLAVDWRKQQRVRRLSLRWLGMNPAPVGARRRNVRFDVVSVTELDVQVIQDAF